MSEIISNLYLSVLFFFALSAFTLAHSDRVAPTTYRAYLVKRVFRIAPLFYLILAWNLSRIDFPDISLLLANVFFLFNLIPGWEQSLVWAGWSVGVEMPAYVVLPLLFVICSTVTRALIAFIIGTVVSVICWWLFDGAALLPRYYAYFFVGANLCWFLAGILAYRLFKHLSVRKIKHGSSFVAIATLAFIAFAYFDPLSIHYRSPAAYFATWALAFALACTWQAMSPARVLGSRPMQWLGDRSFSIYLFHPIVIELTKPIYATISDVVGVGTLGAYLACLGITLPILFVLAGLSYRLVEIPGIALGRRISAHLSRAPQDRQSEHLEDLKTRGG